MTRAREEAPPTKRWLRFSLRSALAAMLIFVLGLAAVHWYMARYRFQATAAVRFHNDGGKFATKVTGPEWLRSIYGDDSFQEITELNLDECSWSEESFGYVTRLPELEVLVLSGPEVTDEHLRRLETLQNLRGLVLDSTTTTDAGIAALHEAIPGLAVHKSERRIVNHIATLVAPAVENEGMGFGFALLSQAPAKYDGKTESVELDGPAWLREFAGEEHFKSILSISLPRPIRAVFMGGFSDTSTPDDVFFVDDDALLGMRLGGLSRLTHLSITSRQVSGVGLAGLRGATSLTHLDLEGTKIDDAGLEHLQGLTNLKRLNLNKTKVGDRGMVHLRDLLSLEVLLMSETNVSGAGLLHLENLTNLKQLDLSATPLAGLSSIRNLTKLEKLDIGGCNITDDELRHLKNLHRLPRLDLSGNPTTPAALQHLSAMTSLKELTMGDGLFVDDDVPLFYPLKGLKKLSFHGLVTEQAIGRLRVAMPGLDDVACNRGGGATFGVIGGLESLRTKIRFVRLGKTDTMEIHGLEVLHLSEMSGLGGLKHLNFQYCFVRDEDLARLGGLPDLEELNLAAWRLTDAGLANLDRFPRLRRLKLPWRTTDAGMRHLAKAKSLEALDLDETKVSDAGLIHLAKLPLESITFTNTAVTGSGLRHLANPSRMKTLYMTEMPMVCYTVAADIPDQIAALTRRAITCEQIARFKNLRQLTLAGATIGDDDLGQLAALRELRSLRLDGTSIGDRGLAAMSGLTSLEELDLRNTNVSDEGLRSLASMKHLKTLNLIGTKITDAAFEHLAKLESLEVVWLDFTQVGDATLDALSALPKLKEVSLHGTQVTQEAAERVRGKRPELNVDLPPPRQVLPADTPAGGGGGF